MIEGMFQSTTIPVLEQVVCFAQARHTVLAGNIANMDTPGYQVRDLSVEDFQNRLSEALAARGRPGAYRSPGETGYSGETTMAKVAKNHKTILRHDKSNVGPEFQVSEMTKNHIQHNMALSIMASQFRLLQAAISERV
jgi:flagellar basal-body rod protein FlgB